MKTQLYLLALLTLVITACSNPKDKLAQEIAALETSDHQSGETKSELNLLIEQFVNTYPDDSLSKTYLENLSYYYFNVDSTALAKKYATQYIETYDSATNKHEFALIIARSLYKENQTMASIDAFEQVQNGMMLSIADMRILAMLHKTLLEDTSSNATELHWFKYAALVEHTDGVDASISAYQGFYEKFPDSELATSAMMMQADQLESKGSLEAAAEVYKKIISTYPESEQAHTAQVILDKELIGLSGKEMLEKIMADKNKSTN
ncbi:MAG: tetratricopeptide (TPR) repeat protein [Bacteroidia bacterium]|jgi:tetratricopeptide (TPR) repeat protein